MKIPETPSQVLNAPSYLTKNTIPMQKTPNTATKTPNTATKTASTATKTVSTPNINYAVLSQIYAPFWRTIYRPKNAVASKK